MREKCLAAAALAIMLAWASVAGAADKKAPAAPAGPAVDEATVQYDSLSIKIAAYAVKPQGMGKHPAVLLLHDAAGLTDGIKQIARNLAQAGYVVLAPDFLSRFQDKPIPKRPAGPAASLNVAMTMSDTSAAFDMLAMNPNVDPAKISVVGIGWGGWRGFKLAEDKAALYRLVVYYGIAPDENEISQIKAPVLVHYAQADFLVTAAGLSLEKRIPKFTSYVYPHSYRGFAGGGGAGGADLAATTGEGGGAAEALAPGDNAAKVQDESAAAAKAAMERTLAFLK